MRLIGSLVITLVLAAPSFAEDGCGKFAWPLTRERQQLAATPTMDAKAGAALPSLPRTALVLHLASAGDAKFTLPPERKPKAATWFGGALLLPAPAKAGIYQVTLSDEAWIDLVQDGRYAHSVGSTGRSDCPGVRKSVRFELGSSPFALQVSGATSDKITMSIEPVP